MMTKWPAPNRCKTRLATAIGACQAASIQKRLIIHTISVANNLKRRGLIEIKIAIAGIGSKKGKRWERQEKIFKTSSQGHGTLGLRMRREVIKVQRKNKFPAKEGQPTILIGTDLPCLCELDLIKALKKLESNDMVVGPAIDGGYWLLGLSKSLVKPVASWPFTGIPWGSNDVLKETINRARLNGIRYALLNQLNDLDEIIDLTPWQK